MSFEEDGFLSKNLGVWIEKVRQDHHQWFDLAAALNRLAMKILYRHSPLQTSDKQLVGAVIFGRALQSFQAAILLAERGMIADARTLVRSCAESAIGLGGVAHDDSFIDELIDDYFKHRLSVANVMASDPECSKGLTPEQLEGLERVKTEILDKYQASKPSSVKWDVVATRVGMTTLYNTIYRGMSGDAAHVTADALNRHIKADDQADIEHLIFEPAEADLEDTISAAVSALFHAMYALEKAFDQHDEDVDVKQLLAKWRQLTEQGNGIGKPA